MHKICKINALLPRAQGWDRPEGEPGPGGGGGIPFGGGAGGRGTLRKILRIKNIY